MIKVNILFITSAISLFITVELFAQSWTLPENVTNNVDIFDQKPSLDIGPAPLIPGEAAHIAYSRFDIKEIFYAIKEFNQQPPSWSISQATNRQATNAPNSENWDASLKAISTGRVYIAYRGDVSGATNEIFITNNVNGSFNFLPSFVTLNSIDDWEPSLAISGFFPYIAFAGSGGTGSPPADQDNEIWYSDLQTPSQATVNSWDDRLPSLAIDSNGKAHIAYVSIGGAGDVTSDNEIWYAENTSGSWSITQVTVNGVGDRNPSLWLDSSGKAHITWQMADAESSWDIYYTHNITTPFPNINTRVTLEPENEEEPSLVVDPFGFAHIVYQWDIGNGNIYYTNNINGSFTSMQGEQILASNSASTNNIYPSMDIDANNYLHLAYQGFDNADTEIYHTVTTTSVPVELIEFAAMYYDEHFRLEWRTATESNNYGFEIEQSYDGQRFIKIGFVPGSGTTTEPQSYSFIDPAQHSVSYYRLKQIDRDGTFHYSRTLRIENTLPFFNLSPNFPNPFNPTTTLSYYIPLQKEVDLSIYNVQGKFVKNLVKEFQKAGNYSIKWNGRNQYGEKMANGVYLARLTTEHFTRTIKMLKIK